MTPAPRFLIDENLSPQLTPLAHARGFEAQHVNGIGLRTFMDWTLMEIIAEHGWTLVTNNVLEFEERFRVTDVHAGVIFIVQSVRLDLQKQFFDLALNEAERIGDLTNHAIRVEITGEFVDVTSYELPSS